MRDHLEFNSRLAKRTFLLIGYGRFVAGRRVKLTAHVSLLSGFEVSAQTYLPPYVLSLRVNGEVYFYCLIITWPVKTPTIKKHIRKFRFIT